MDTALPEYRQKLIVKIIAARSEDQIRRFIETVFRTLATRSINGHIIERFLDKLVNELNERLKDNLQSVDNIRFAIQVLQSIKAQWHQPENKFLLSP